jgi:sulfur carrier protein ThiS
MIEITVSFAGTIYIEKLERGGKVQVKNGTSIFVFLLEKGLNEQHLKLIIPVVNGDEKPLSYILQHNDKLNIFMPVGGG